MTEDEDEVDASANVPYSWKVLLGAMIIDRRKLLEQDPGQHHDTLPRMRNTDERLQEFETEQGERLPDGLRGFLLHGDGWEGAWRDLGVFGLADLRGEDNGKPAAILLNRIANAGTLAEVGLTMAEAIAVAVGPPDHVVVTSRRTEETVWFSQGRVYERFEDFPMFFFELLNLQRDRLEELGES